MDISALLRAFCDAVERHDGKAFAALFAEEAIYHDVFYGSFSRARENRRDDRRFLLPHSDRLPLEHARPGEQRRDAVCALYIQLSFASS